MAVLGRRPQDKSPSARPAGAPSPSVESRFQVYMLVLVLTREVSALFVRETYTNRARLQCPPLVVAPQGLPCLQPVPHHRAAPWAERNFALRGGGGGGVQAPGGGGGGVQKMAFQGGLKIALLGGMAWAPGEGGGGGGAFQKWASMPGPLFCVRTDVAAKGAGTKILAGKHFFHEKSFPHICVVKMISATWEFILSHVPPPPPARQVGQRQPTPPSQHGDQGGGGLGKWVCVPSPPPPPQSNFLPAQVQEPSLFAFTLC